MPYVPYVLGVDVGTCHTTAAVCRHDGGQWGPAEAVWLDTRSVAANSVLVRTPNRSYAVGEPPPQRAGTDAHRVARDVVGRVGDDAPLLLAGEPHPAHTLTAALVRWAVDQVVAHEGGPPDHIVVTHSAAWGPYRRDLMLGALRRAGLGTPTLLPRPVAVAESHAARAPVDADGLLAVHSLGSGVVECSVVARTSAGTFRLLGNAESTAPPAGAQLDDVLVDHVLGRLGFRLDRLDHADPDARSAMAHLRAACTLAKETLSVAAEVTVPVRLPGAHGDVLVARHEFEDLIRPVLQPAADLLRRTVQGHLPPGRMLDAVVLAGGSARIPLLTELVTAVLASTTRPDGTAFPDSTAPPERTALPEGRVALEPDPELTTARGAALAARRLVPGPPLEPALPSPVERTSIIVRQDDAVRLLADEPFPLPDPSDEPPPRPPVEITPPDLPRPRSMFGGLTRRRSTVVGTALLVALMVGALLAFAAKVVTSAPNGSPAGSPLAATSSPPGLRPADQSAAQTTTPRDTSMTRTPFEPATSDAAPAHPGRAKPSTP